jgi:hypothetical protein
MHLFEFPTDPALAPQDYTLSELVALYKQPVFVAFGSVLLAVLVVCIVYVHRLHKKCLKRRATAAVTPVSLKPMSDEGSATLLSPRVWCKCPEVSDDAPDEKYPMAYTLIGSVLGATGFLFAKSFSQLCKESLAGHNQFTHGFSYFIVAVFFASGLGRIHYVNSVRSARVSRCFPCALPSVACCVSRLVGLE